MYSVSLPQGGLQHIFFPLNYLRKWPKIIIVVLLISFKELSSDNQNATNNNNIKSIDETEKKTEILLKNIVDSHQ